MTHVFFAYRLLEVSGKDTAATTCSLFPQIDRKPPYFHRLYAHNIAMIPLLAPIGEEVMLTGKVPRRYRKNYAWERFGEERARILDYEGKLKAEAGLAVAKSEPDYLSCALSYLSHIYLDTYNNPVQAFLPDLVVSCGQTGLWEKLHPIAFRLSLYEQENIKAFRKRLYFNKLWDVKLLPQALVYALIKLTADTCLTKVGKDLIDKTYKSMKVGALPSHREIRDAVGFLSEKEDMTIKLTLDYGRRHLKLPKDARAPMPPR